MVEDLSSLKFHLQQDVVLHCVRQVSTNESGFNSQSSDDLISSTLKSYVGHSWEMVHLLLLLLLIKSVLYKLIFFQIVYVSFIWSLTRSHISSKWYVTKGEESQVTLSCMSVRCSIYFVQIMNVYPFPFFFDPS